MTNSLDLTPYHLIRPTKVEWMLPSVPVDPISVIKSKGTRKFLSNSLQRYIDEAELMIVEEELSLAEYLTWLPYYVAKMAENEFDVFANQEWYTTKISHQNTVYGIFIYQKEEMVGSAVITQNKDHKFTINFKASDKIRSITVSNASLGTLIEYYYWKMAMRLGAKTISSGTSRNAFGVINHFGYLNFKTRFGYEPSVSPKGEEIATVDCLPNKPVSFYAFHQEDSSKNLKLFVYNFGQPIDEQVKEALVYSTYEVIS